MFTPKLAMTASALALVAAPVWASTQVQAVTDLNLRTGPGPQYEIASVIDAKGAVDLQGCLEQSNWCKVSYEGTEGWAYGEYLTGTVTEKFIPVVASDSPVTVGTVTYDAVGETDEEMGAIGGAIAGGLVAGPAGVLAGALAGAAAGEAAVPDERVVTYVRTHEVEPVYVQGEVVTGVIVPQKIQLAEIPDSDYRYAYINGVPVLVETENRTVIHVVR